MVDFKNDFKSNLRFFVRVYKNVCAEGKLYLFCLEIKPVIERTKLTTQLFQSSVELLTLDPSLV